MPPLKSYWQAPVSLSDALRWRLHAVSAWRLRWAARYNGTNLQLRGRVRVAHPVYIQGDGRVELGDEVRLGYRLAGALGQPILLQARTTSATISIGDGARIMNGCELIALERIEIGRACLIGPGSRFFDSDGHGAEPCRRDLSGATGPVTLEDNVWIGAHVTILKGVRVGRDAVVGAGAIVTKNIPSGGIAVGSPAKVIGSVYA